MNNPKIVIITGVSGQDGSYMADYLLANTDYNIYGMVRRTSKPDYGNLINALKNPRFKLVTGDLSDSGSIEALIRDLRPDYFINLAAQSFVGSSWQLPEQTIDVGTLGVIRCLEAIRKHAPQCHLYSAGSSEMFGDVAYSPQDEKHPFRPRSPYGVGKCAAHYACKVWRESYGIYAVSGILFNHESERRGEEFVSRKITLGVARIVYALQHGLPFQPIELGNLDSKRDWSHAMDFVDGIWKMLNQDGAPQEYVLASGETHTVREFVELSFKEAGIRGEWFKLKGSKPEEERFITIKPYPVPVYDKTLVVINPSFYRPAEVSLLHGDSSRARAELGWTPKISFSDLVHLMAQNDIKIYSP